MKKVEIRTNDKNLKALEESLDKIHPIAEWNKEKFVGKDRKDYWRYSHED